ncbi:MAG: hypothetical protein R2811_12865 [Flavobacteriales bacterium]
MNWPKILSHPLAALAVSIGIASIGFIVSDYSSLTSVFWGIFLSFCPWFCQLVWLQWLSADRLEKSLAERQEHIERTGREHSELMERVLLYKGLMDQIIEDRSGGKHHALVVFDELLRSIDSVSSKNYLDQKSGYKDLLLDVIQVETKKFTNRISADVGHLSIRVLQSSERSREEFRELWKAILNSARSSYLAIDYPTYPVSLGRESDILLDRLQVEKARQLTGRDLNGRRRFVRVFVYEDLESLESLQKHMDWQSEAGIEVRMISDGEFVNLCSYHFNTIGSRDFALIDDVFISALKYDVHYPPSSYNDGKWGVDLVLKENKVRAAQAVFKLLVVDSKATLYNRKSYSTLVTKLGGQGSHG